MIWPGQSSSILTFDWSRDKVQSESEMGAANKKAYHVLMLGGNINISSSFISSFACSISISLSLSFSLSLQRSIVLSFQLFCIFPFGSDFHQFRERKRLEKRLNAEKMHLDTHGQRQSPCFSHVGKNGRKQWKKERKKTRENVFALHRK